jgi:GT2 family glycosyltransferase
MNEDVTVVLISHKSKDLILNFIREIYNRFKIIIIDNSNDKALEKEIEQNYPNVTLELVENNGYGAAINYASKLIKTNYFLISNPDINGLTEKNILDFVAAAKTLDDKFSSLGPRFLNVDPKSHIQSNHQIIIAEMKFISGACMFFKKETFQLLGGFDENFFLYFEESDFCLRAHKINKNYQINNIKIHHNTGSSVYVDNHKEKKEIEKLRNWHFIWSKFYYYKKNYGLIFSVIYFIPTLIRTVFRIFLYSLINNDEKREKYLIRFSGLYCSIRGIKSYKRLSNNNL